VSSGKPQSPALDGKYNNRQTRPHGLAWYVVALLVVGMAQALVSGATSVRGVLRDHGEAVYDGTILVVWGHHCSCVSFSWFGPRWNVASLCVSR
jgi:hypothetical protein